MPSAGPAHSGRSAPLHSGSAAPGRPAPTQSRPGFLRRPDDAVPADDLRHPDIGHDLDQSNDTEPEAGARLAKVHSEARRAEFPVRAYA